MKFLQTITKRNASLLSSLTGTQKYNISVIGAAGRVGQTVSLLLKLSSMISRLHIYDKINAVGVEKDLFHVESNVTVKNYENNQACMKNTDIVVVTASSPRKPGMRRNDSFNTNAAIIKDIASNMAEVAPNALLAIVTDPLNSLVPVACDILAKRGSFDPKKVFGVTSVDSRRASQMYAELLDLDSRDISVPVIGGHSTLTMIPLMSKLGDKLDLTPEEIEGLTKKIRTVGQDIIDAKKGAEPAILSTAYSVSKFVHDLMRGLAGEPNIIAPAYVKSNVTEAEYFANNLLLGKNGIEENLGFGELSEYEQTLLKQSVEELKKHIKQGRDYVARLSKL